MDYVARQAPLSMEFSKQEYRSGLPFLSPGDLPDPGIKLESPTLQAVSLQSEPLGKIISSTYCHPIESHCNPSLTLGQSLFIGLSVSALILFQDCFIYNSLKL